MICMILPRQNDGANATMAAVPLDFNPHEV